MLCRDVPFDNAPVMIAVGHSYVFHELQGQINATSPPAFQYPLTVFDAVPVLTTVDDDEAGHADAVMYKDSDMSVQSTDSLPSEDSEYDELETSLAAEQSMMNWKPIWQTGSLRGKPMRIHGI